MPMTQQHVRELMHRDMNGMEDVVPAGHPRTKPRAGTAVLVLRVPGHLPGVALAPEVRRNAD